MPNQRPDIPARISDEVLYRNKHICCICMRPNKHVQIHHIDSDSSNNGLSNLAVVCLDCHSLVTGQSGLGRRYSPGEVRKYKRAWEQIVAVQSKAHKAPSARVQRELIGQIDIIICQILSTPDHARRKEFLEVLYNIHLWRGTPKIDKQIIEGFSHLAVMSGLGIPSLAKEVAIQTWQLCWHFIGPHYAKMDRSGERFVIECVDVIGTVADFNCMMEKNLAALKAALASSEIFFDVAIWYKRKAIAEAVVKVYTNALGSCGVGERVEFPTGINALRLSLRKLSKALTDSKLKWPGIKSRLRHLAQHG